MSSKLRIVLIIVGVLIVLLLAAPFLIPVNQFRPTIEEKASSALGRKVELGNLSLSLLSGSLSAENLSIGDDSRFGSTPFLTAKSLKVGVEILPLIFSKKLNVTGITIDGPQLTLLRNAAGQWNYSSLGSGSAKAQPKSAPSGSSPDSSAAPADITIQKLDLKDGRITVGRTNSQKTSTYDHLNVTATNVSITSKFPIAVGLDLPSGGKLKLDGNLGPVDQADASLTPFDGKLNLDALNLASTGFLDPSAGLGGILDLDANLSSSGGEAATTGSAKLSKALLVAGGSPAGVPVTVEFNTKYNLHKSTGLLHPSILRIGSATAHLNGTYGTSGEETALNIKVDGHDMPAKDFEAFLPALGINLPKGASLQAGTLNADLTLAGPTNKLVTTGNVGLFNGKLAGFDLGSKFSAIGSLAGIKSGKDLDIEKLTTNLRMAPDGLKADNFVAVVPAVGNMTGAGTIDSKNNLDFKMMATLGSTAGSTSAAPANGASGVLGELTGGGNCKNGTSVPFQIQGTTAEPKFIPDVGGLAAGMFKSLACSGASTDSAAKPQQNLNSTVDALSGLFKKKKP